jgi:hypothetical protein
MTSTKIDNLEGSPKVRALRPDATEGSTRVVANPVGGHLKPSVALVVEEMAFTRQGDIDAYARGLSIPPETIEKWISAGLLFPDEIRMAERIIKILREKIKVS